MPRRKSLLYSLYQVHAIYTHNFFFLWWQTIFTVQHLSNTIYQISQYNTKTKTIEYLCEQKENRTNNARKAKISSISGKSQILAQHWKLFRCEQLWKSAFMRIRIGCCAWKKSIQFGTHTVQSAVAHFEWVIPSVTFSIYFYVIIILIYYYRQPNQKSLDDMNAIFMAIQDKKCEQFTCALD